MYVYWTSIHLDLWQLRLKRRSEHLDLSYLCQENIVFSVSWRGRTGGSCLPFLPGDKLGQLFSSTMRDFYIPSLRRELDAPL